MSPALAAPPRASTHLHAPAAPLAPATAPPAPPAPLPPLPWAGVPCWCVLHARVHAVEPPPELRAVLTGGAGPGGHNDERLSFVSNLVRQCGFASLMDVGCGEGKLLVRLVQDGASVDGCVQLVGLEPDPKPSVKPERVEPQHPRPTGLPTPHPHSHTHTAHPALSPHAAHPPDATPRRRARGRGARGGGCGGRGDAVGAALPRRPGGCVARAAVVRGGDDGGGGGAP